MTAKQLAQELLALLIRKKRISRKPNIHEWESAFQAVLNDGYFSAQDIKETIDAYGEHLCHSYTPMPATYCGKSFCENIVAIKDAILFAKVENKHNNAW